MRHSSQIEILQPLTSVWAYFIDHNNLSQWLSGLVSHEIISGSGREVGALARHVYQENDRAFEFDERIKARTDQQFFAHVLENTYLDTHIDYHFTATGDATQVECHLLLEPKGFKMKLALPLYQHEVVQRHENALNNLKVRVEGR